MSPKPIELLIGLHLIIKSPYWTMTEISHLRRRLNAERLGKDLKNLPKFTHPFSLIKFYLNK